MGSLLKLALSSPKLKRGRKGKEVKMSKDDKFLEAQKNKARHYAKNLDIADSIKLGKVKDSFAKRVQDQELAKRKQPVKSVESHGPIAIKTLVNNIKEVHLPAGISGKAYNQHYRDWLLS